MDMIGKVRRMKLRDQLSLSEIANRTGLPAKYGQEMAQRRGKVVPKYEQRNVKGKLTALKPFQQQVLTIDTHRPEQSRRSGRALFAKI